MHEWKSYIEGFQVYMRLEKAFSSNTREAYMRDLHGLMNFLEEYNYHIAPQGLVLEHLQEYLKYLSEIGLSGSSQVRMLSGIRAFYHYLILEEIIDEDPTALLVRPNPGKHLPEVLSYEEVKKIINGIDSSTYHGARNVVIIEVLYACGLRVSELINLKLSDVMWDDEFLSIVGKGNKQRFVPIHRHALDLMKYYLENGRIGVKEKKNSEGIFFLNRNGGKLTRQMIHHIVETSAKAAGITKNVYPHIFRHSFASELINNGADLRAVQEMLGHVSITTTEIYTHLDDNNLREALLLYHPFYKQ